MTRRNPEMRLHCAILDYLRVVLPPAAAATLIHVPMGENRNAITGAKLRRMGARAGVEDMQFALYGRLHAIEVKPEGARLARAQKDRQAALVAAGGRYAVCRSLADIDETLIEWCIPTRLTAP